MVSRLKRIVKYILGLFFSILFSTISCAYVLEGPHIIHLMTEQLGQADSLFISQKVIFYDIQTQPESSSQKHSPEEDTDAAENSDSHPPVSEETDEAGELLQPEILSQNNGFSSDTGAVENMDNLQALSDKSDELGVQPKTIQLDESLRYLFSEAFRSDIISDDNQRIFVFRNGQTLTVIDGVISEDRETRFDLYKDLLFYRSREALSARLSSLGVDISVSSLGKFDGQIAYVLGAEYPDESLPQVWIDLAAFYPLRMIIPSKSSAYGNDFLEIRYSEWRKISKIWYPMRTEFIQDGKTVRAIEVNDYQINPSFSKDIFDIARLRLEYREPVKTTTRSGESDGLSEVQKTIEEFKKIFE
jgi:hypothetical protein